MPRVFSPSPRARWLLALTAAGLVLAAVVAPRFWRKENPELAAPRLALESLSAKSLYFNGFAQPWLLAQRPDLLSDDDRDLHSERSRAFAQAVLNPKLFRQLDRRYRFDAVLFIGDPSSYRALLDHLGETKDFSLAYADHAALVFRRDVARLWSLHDLETVQARLGKLSSHDEARFLALTAVKLAAAKHEPDAKMLLDRARALDGRCPEVWSGLADYYLERAEWSDALDAANHALALDSRHLAALAAKAQAFYATKRFNEAYAVSQRLIELLPDDPNLLFRHAQIAHEAHAYTTEISTLEKLIALADLDQRSTTGYRLYLAQAYTAAGKGQPAIDNFTRVLSDPELPEDQRKFASDSIVRIKSRTGL